MVFGALAPARSDGVKSSKEGVKETSLEFSERAIKGGVTAYLLYNGSATYVQ